MNTGVSSLCKKEYEQLHFNIFFAPKQDSLTHLKSQTALPEEGEKIDNFKRQLSICPGPLPSDPFDRDKYHPSVPPKTLKIILPTTKKGPK